MICSVTLLAILIQVLFFRPFKEYIELQITLLFHITSDYDYVICDILIQQKHNGVYKWIVNYEVDISIFYVDERFRNSYYNFLLVIRRDKENMNYK